MMRLANTCMACADATRSMRIGYSYDRQAEHIRKSPQFDNVAIFPRIYFASQFTWRSGVCVRVRLCHENASYFDSVSWANVDDSVSVTHFSSDGALEVRTNDHIMRNGIRWTGFAVAKHGAASCHPWHTLVCACVCDVADVTHAFSIRSYATVNV